MELTWSSFLRSTDPGAAPPAVLDLLRHTAAAGGRVMSVCSGAFTLGAAGLLDDRDCTTHWRYAADLAAQFPRARVNPNVLFVCDGPVVTSAGTAVRPGPVPAPRSARTTARRSPAGWHGGW